MKLLNGLLSNTKPIKELVSESYHGKLKASKSELEKSLTGGMTEHHRFMIRKMFAHISRVEALMQEVDEEMGIKTSAFKERIELLQTIPGVGKESAIGIISETGVDMAVFPTEHHLASWAGMSPGKYSEVMQTVVVPLLDEPERKGPEYFPGKENRLRTIVDGFRQNRIDDILRPVGKNVDDPLPK